MATNYFLYARKSTDTEERQVLSIEAQLVELKQFAEKENLRIKEVFQEAMTAKEPGRPIFNDMLQRLKKGEAQGIIAWHPDRLARNSIDGGQIIYLVDTKQIEALKFPTFWFDSTPQGKFMLSIAFGQSKYFIDNLSENIRRGLRQKIRRGEWPSKLLPGYTHDRYSKGLVIDPHTGPKVKKFFEIYAQGEHTLADMIKISTELGLEGRTQKPWSKSVCQYTLKNSFYYGLMRYKGELHQGKHEPLITKALFDQAQKVMVRRGKPQKYKKKYFPLLGLASCPQCGCSITATLKKGHNYYHCTKRRGPCPERYTREELYAQQISQALSNVALPTPAYNFMMTELAKERHASNQSLAPQRLQMKTQIKECEDKLNRLLDAHLEGLVDKTEYNNKKSELLRQKADCEGILVKLESGTINWLEPCTEFVKAAHQAGFLSQSENLESQKNFLKKIGWNFRLAARRLSFQYSAPWGMLAENSTFISDFAGLNSGSGAEFAEPTGKNSKNRGQQMRASGAFGPQKEVCLRMFRD